MDVSSSVYFQMDVVTFGGVGFYLRGIRGLVKFIHKFNSSSQCVYVIPCAVSSYKNKCQFCVCKTKKIEKAQAVLILLQSIVNIQGKLHCLQNSMIFLLNELG